jgi:hypothetical protein
MNSNRQSDFVSSKRFKSLPDGRRVFLVSYPWTGYYVVPDTLVEHQLAKKVSWEFFLSFLSLVVSLGGAWGFRDAMGKYAFILIPIIAFSLVALIRWVLYRNEIPSLQKIDYPPVG